MNLPSTTPNVKDLVSAQLGVMQNLISQSHEVARKQRDMHNDIVEISSALAALERAISDK